MIQEFKLAVDRPRTHPLIFLVVSCCIHISALFCWSLVVKSACLMFKIPSLDLKPSYLLIATPPLVIVLLDMPGIAPYGCLWRWEYHPITTIFMGISHYNLFFFGKMIIKYQKPMVQWTLPASSEKFATNARWTQISNWFKMVYIRGSKLHIFQMFRHV